MDFKHQFGPWAIVTGASSGLGQEFATQLASLGLNLVLTARTEDKLKSLAADLRADFNIETRIIINDLTELDSVDVLYVRCADLDIGLVVSNAGATNLHSYLSYGIDEVRKGIQLNVNAHADLARYFGDAMITRRGGRGGLLFMSSIVGLQGTPYLSLYSAAKAFILSFAEALHYENLSKGLHVTAVTPGPLTTPMLSMTPNSANALKASRLTLLDADAVVQGSLNALERNKVIYIPGRYMRWRFGILRRYFFSRSANVHFWGKTMRRYMRSLLNTALLRPESSK